MPKPDIVDEQWALYRRVQVQLLYALEYRHRYGNTTAKAKSVDIEHDVCDAQYCITGVLAGALATDDNQLKEFFTPLSPQGFLLEKT